MRIIRKKFRPRKIEEIKKHRINEQIQSPQVLLIDDTGANLGAIDTSKALGMAHERGLDLIEVSPLANPPVAKILDYNKFRYQEEKEKKKTKAKQKKVEIKGIRLSLTIGQNDLNNRVNQSLQFLEDNDKVRVELQLRGREQQRKDIAREIIKQFITRVEEALPIKVEQEIEFQAGKFSAIIAKRS